MLIPAASCGVFIKNKNLLTLKRWGEVEAARSLGVSTSITDPKSERKMGQKAAVIFPHQLFKRHPSLSEPEISVAFLVEEDRFFTEFRFNKKKLLLHRAALKYYEDLLNGRGWKVEYVENRPGKTMTKLSETLGDRGISLLKTAEIVDRPLEATLFEGLKGQGIEIKIDTSRRDFLRLESSLRTSSGERITVP